GRAVLRVRPGRRRRERRRYIEVKWQIEDPCHRHPVQLVERRWPPFPRRVNVAARGRGGLGSDERRAGGAIGHATHATRPCERVLRLEGRRLGAATPEVD